MCDIHCAYPGRDPWTSSDRCVVKAMGAITHPYTAVHGGLDMQREHRNIGYENCEKVVVWKPGNLNEQERREMYVNPGEVRFSKVFAMPGNGRETSTSPSD